MTRKHIIVVLLLTIFCIGCSNYSNNDSTTTTDTTSDVTLGVLDEIENSTDVATDTVYQYTFSEDINTGTVTSDTFFIVPTTSADIYSASISARSFDPSACDVSRALEATVECVQLRCTLTPAASLTAGRGYTVCLTSDIAYNSGASFEGEASNFRTALASDASADYVLDTRYFSDSSYTDPPFEALAEIFRHIDPDEIIDDMSDSVNSTKPDDIHGNSFLFDPCPSSSGTADATAIIYVPGDYQTIQEAIDAAGDYQTIQITAGLTYTENLVVNSKFVHLVASSNVELVDLKAADAAKPNITLNCGGGALVYGFQIRDGLYGIKGNGTSKGVNVLQASIVKNVTTGIVMKDSIVVITDNVFENIGDGINLVTCSGMINSNTIVAPDDIGIYLYGPLGIEVAANIFNDGAGQGAIFITGGSAVIKENDLNLSEQGFGIFAEFTDASLGVKTEIVSNVIDDAIGIGIAVLGNGGTATEAYLKDNIVRNTGTAIGNTKFDWMDYAAPSDSNQIETGKVLIQGNGIVVLDAKADADGNVSDNNFFAGYYYLRSCGTLDENSGYLNLLYGLALMQDGDTDGCSDIDQVLSANPMFTTNDFQGNNSNMITDGGMSVPPPPKLNGSLTPSQDD